MYIYILFEEYLHIYNKEHSPVFCITTTLLVLQLQDVDTLRFGGVGDLSSVCCVGCDDAADDDDDDDLLHSTFVVVSSNTGDIIECHGPGPSAAGSWRQHLQENYV